MSIHLIVVIKLVIKHRNTMFNPFYLLLFLYFECPYPNSKAKAYIYTDAHTKSHSMLALKGQKVIVL